MRLQVFLQFCFFHVSVLHVRQIETKTSELFSNNSSFLKSTWKNEKYPRAKGRFAISVQSESVERRRHCRQLETRFNFTLYSIGLQVLKKNKNMHIRKMVGLLVCLTFLCSSPTFAQMMPTPQTLKFFESENCTGIAGQISEFSLFDLNVTAPENANSVQVYGL